MIRYCHGCGQTAEHTVRVAGAAGGNAPSPHAARWHVCSKCGTETRAYDLRRRSWAGK